MKRGQVVNTRIGASDGRVLAVVLAGKKESTYIVTPLSTTADDHGRKRYAFKNKQQLQTVHEDHLKPVSGESIKLRQNMMSFNMIKESFLFP